MRSACRLLCRHLASICRLARHTANQRQVIVAPLIAAVVSIGADFNRLLQMLVGNS